MKSPHALARLRREEAAKPDKLTIVVFGWQDLVYEPHLLEALANHPGVGKLFYVPLDGVGAATENLLRKEMQEVTTRCIDKKIRSLKIESHHPSYKNMRSWLPEDMQQPVQFPAYELTGLLKRHGFRAPDVETIRTSLKEHFAAQPPEWIPSDHANLILNGHGEHWLNLYMPLRHPNIPTVNGVAPSITVDDKTQLPHLRERIYSEKNLYVLPDCVTVYGVADIEHIMDTYGLNQLVLKHADKTNGHGVYRVYRDAESRQLMVDIPAMKDAWNDDLPAGHLPLVDLPMPPEGMLAMEWMDVSRGDIRAVLAHGSCVGAYNRLPKEASWLCNYSQGGEIQPVDLRRDLSQKDRRRLNAIAQSLKEQGLPLASVDLLANHKGERMLSEVNIGLTDDLMEFEKHRGADDAARGRLSVPDRIAGMIVEAHRQWRAESAKSVSAAR